MHNHFSGGFGNRGGFDPRGGFGGGPRGGFDGSPRGGFGGPHGFGPRPGFSPQGTGMESLFIVYFGAVLRIRDPGWVKYQDPDHISESLENFFESKYLNSFMWIRDQGYKNSDPGSGLTSRIQHCFGGRISTKLNPAKSAISIFTCSFGYGTP
jgi:hypothetical protein